MDVLQNALRENRAYLCLSCGKCTAVCPVSRQDGGFSPRRLVERATLEEDKGWLSDSDVWKCLTCLRCSELCPGDVHFSEFVRDARSVALEEGNAGVCTHGDVIQTWMRVMADPDLQQNRLDWVTEDLHTSQDSDTLYFVGCLPHYDVLFGVGAKHSKESGSDGGPAPSQAAPAVTSSGGNASPLLPQFEGVEIARNTVRLLNRAGIAPRLLSDERCCGHDLLWTGDKEGFRQLAELNARLFADAGIRRVVTACAECYRTLSVDYPAFAGVEVEVRHVSQVLAEAAQEGKLAFEHSGLPVTFQDPCRLGRHMGEYDAPRELLEAAAELRDMEHARQQSICCGTSAWTQCGHTAKTIQVERLKEARATGAETLVTACPKCQIHFTCALADADVDDTARIPVRDLTTILWESLSRRDDAAAEREE